jgi:uncharacterized membrane protein YeaQ/YmgE (transglycosylase-associated protein family)
MWSIGTIIITIIVGLIIGALGRLVVPGRQPIPIWLTIIIGIVASFIGAWIGTLFGYHNANGGIAWLPFVVGVGAAVVLIAIWEAVRGRRTRHGVLR